MSSEEDGKLIALEGPDGCGKSTQVEMLAEWLKSKDFEVETTKEPTDGPIGKILRDNLENKLDLCLETEALLFAGDRAEHVSDTIRPYLENGKIVITGRYVYSSLVYQTVRGLSKEWVEEINKPAIKPDLTVFIDVPPETGLDRVNSSGEPDKFEENLELQKKVSNAYQNLAEEKNIPVIDGTLTKEKVQKKIREKVQNILHADLG